MHVFFVIEEKLEANHHQKCSAKSGYSHMAWAKNLTIQGRISNCQVNSLPWVEIAKYGHYKERKENSHANYSNKNTPGQKSSSPFSIHILEYSNIDDSIVEWQRDFQDTKNQYNKQRRKSRRKRPSGHVPHKSAGEKAQNRKDDTISEVFKHNE